MSWLEEAQISLTGDKKSPPKKENSTTKLPEYFHVFDEPKSHVKTTGDLINEFASELIDAGFQLTDGLTETTEIPIRCDIDGCKAGTKPGWYYFKRVNNAAFGTYGDWRVDSHTSWAGFLNGAPNKKEISEINEKIAAQARAAKIERDILSVAAVKYVQSKINVLPRLTKHKYFSDKKITAILSQIEVFQMGVGSAMTNADSEAVLPMYDISGATVNWQRINGEGRKLFKKHAVKKGHFHIIGDVQSSKSIIYCEGFATGASIYLTLSCAVVVCFDAGNLLPVMTVTRKLVEGKPVYIGADNDASEVGMKKAEQCRDKYPDVSIAYPPCVGDDFNDMWCFHKGTAEASNRILDRFTMAGYEIPERAELRVWTGEELVSNTPEILKTVPCPRVQEIAEWMETTAPKSSRQIALVGAIVLACGVSGRVFRENEMNNFSSIMACVIAPSGGGKDFAKKCINDILLESKKKSMTDILGSASYTSEAAIRNQLIQNPVKISCIDEFGDKLSRGVKGGAGRDTEAFQAMKEIYSDSRGTWAGRAYAAPDGNKVTKDIRSEPVKNPSLTILGLSTPVQFIGAITDTHIEGGFLNRFVIIDARNDKITKRRRLESEIPDWIVPHCEAVIDKGSQSTYGLQGNLSEMSNAYSQKADPKPIHITDEVSDLFNDFDDHLTEQYAKDDFMTNLSTRWHENARRLAVGLAAFEDPYKPQITIALAQWCISFTQYHGKRLAALIDRYSCFDDHHRNRNMCLEAIRKTTTTGLSRSEMSNINPFRGLSLAKRNIYLNELEEMGDIGINLMGLEKKGEIRYYGTR